MYAVSFTIYLFSPQQWRGTSCGPDTSAEKGSCKRLAGQWWSPLSSSEEEGSKGHHSPLGLSCGGDSSALGWSRGDLVTSRGSSSWELYSTPAASPSWVLSASVASCSARYSFSQSCRAALLEKLTILLASVRVAIFLAFAIERDKTWTEVQAVVCITPWVHIYNTIAGNWSTTFTFWTYEKSRNYFKISPKTSKKPFSRKQDGRSQMFPGESLKDAKD